MKKPTLTSFAKVTFLGLTLALVACGGSDPNDADNSVTQATCKIKTNWNKVQIGHTVGTVLNILGQPDQVTSTTSSSIYGYEACRIFYVQTKKDDVTTPDINEAEFFYRLMPGSVTFTAGYVSAVNSPKYESTETVVRELTEAEVLAYRP